MFPKLTAAQIGRLEHHGERRPTHAGEILFDTGDRPRSFFVVIEGDIELLITRKSGYELFNTLIPGDFTGELNALRGSAGVVRDRAGHDGTLLAIDIERLRTIVQTDAELSELFMRAFILRRMGLIASQAGDVILLGSSQSAGTLRLQQFLTRNSFPFVNLDVNTDSCAQALLKRFHIKVD